MRLDQITPGDVLVTGRRQGLEDGTEGVVVLALAVGAYTTVQLPCGLAVKKLTDGRRPEVVVARPRRAHTGRHGWVKDLADVERDEPWDLGIINSRSLMPYAEWRLKRDAILELKEMDANHERTGERYWSDMIDLVAEALDLPADMFSTSRYWRREDDAAWGPTISTNSEDTQALLAQRDPVAWEKVQELKDAWRAWRQLPLPSQCPR